MKVTLFKTIAAVGLLVAMAAGVSACNGGGGALSLEEYFQKLEEADNTSTERSDAIGARLEDTEDVDEIKDAFSEFPDIIDEFLDEMEGLNPPEEAEDAHNEAVDAGRDFQDEFENALDDIQDAETLDDLIGAIGGTAFNDADERFSEACNKLQSIADDNDIEISLDCED